MNKKIIQAGKSLLSNGVVCFPTETVYAVAADCESNIAIDRIYSLKKRSKESPLALLVSQTKYLRDMLLINNDIELIADKFCPGPITVIAKKSPTSMAAKRINPTLDTIAFRIPDHPTAKELLTFVNKPIAATSANISGFPPATTQQEVNTLFAGKVDYIIGDNNHTIGQASTILDLSNKSPKIIRTGPITKEELQTALNKHIL